MKGPTLGEALDVAGKPVALNNPRYRPGHPTLKSDANVPTIPTRAATGVNSIALAQYLKSMSR